MRLVRVGAVARPSSVCRGNGRPVLGNRGHGTERKMMHCASRSFCPSSFFILFYFSGTSGRIKTGGATLWGGAEVARQAHNLEVAGSNPASATITRAGWERGLRLNPPRQSHDSPERRATFFEVVASVYPLPLLGRSNRG